MGMRAYERSTCRTSTLVCREQPSCTTPLEYEARNPVRVKMSIKYRVALPKDSIAVLNFLREFYYPEEPLTIASEPLQQAGEDEEFNLSNISHGTTILAIALLESNIDNDDDDDLHRDHYEDEGDIVGVIIAGPKYQDEAEEMIATAKTCKSPKWSKMLKLLAHLETRSNIYKYYDITKAVHVHALAVNPAFRGKSIGMRMMEACMTNARELDFNVLSADCTSIYSIKIAEKLGMECLNTLPFAEYKDTSGEQVFRPPHPHNIIKTFAKLI